MINLHYVRAAILANTGIELPLAEVKRLLVEERLITPKQAERNTSDFKGYGKYFDTEHNVKPFEELDTEMGLPD